MSKTRTESYPEPQVVQKADFQAKFTIFLLYGFYFLDKLFVYLSFPVIALMMFDRRVFVDRVYAALTRPGHLNKLAWALLISTMFGIAQVIYGVLLGNPLTTALQILVFNLCPWFLFLGIAAGMQRPFAVRDYIRFLAYFHAIMTPAYYLLLRHVHFSIGGTEIGFQPGPGSVALLGLFCFEKNLGRYWFPILVCSFDTIGAQMRADWVGLGLAVAVWAIATGQMKRTLSMVGVLIALLAVGFVADVKLPAIPGRGGEISARDTVARALSGIDRDLAQEYSSNVSQFAGTIAWRENWWKAIREEVFKSPRTTIFGLGYGYPIKDLIAELKNIDIRSPHSAFYFTLAYSGFVGFFLFVSLQMTVLGVLWKTYKRTGQIFGFAFAIFAIENAMFGNLLEAPNRALPIYIVYGLCIAPLFMASKEPTVDEEERNRHTTRIPARQIATRDWLTTPLPANRSFPQRSK